MNRIIKDALFGALGGLAGTFVIGKVIGAASKLQSEEDRKLEQLLIQEQPTERLARRVVRRVFGVEVEDETKASMGKFVHWGYGTFWGAVYGVLRNRVPVVSWGAGLPFGVSFALFGQAVMLPMTELTPPAHYFPLSAHLRGLTAHYAYAATAEAVCSLAESVEKAVNPEAARTNPDLRRVS